MIYESEIASVRLLDVLALDQGGVCVQTPPRPFSALSFRVKADTTLAAAGEEHHLTDGCVAFVPAQLGYRRESRRDLLVVVHFDAPGYRTDRIEVLRPRHPERLEELFRRIHIAWHEREAGYRLRATAILYDILAECCRQGRAEGGAPSVPRPTAEAGAANMSEVSLRRLDILAECYRQSLPEEGAAAKIRASVEYIHRHFTDPALTVAEVARASYMSEVYLRRLFKEVHGTSPQRYITALRLRRAVALLTSGGHTLKEVAYLSGYTDYKYFTTVFKREVGLSPSEYARRGGAGE